MAYTEIFTNKLDWAMPFQRTGKFPLDRSSMFASYTDALEYAKQTGGDTRALGGTSYVGQLVTVYGPGVDGATNEVAAYIITATGEGAALQRLAQTTATGDFAADIARLDAALSALEARVATVETTVGNLELGDKNIVEGGQVRTTEGGDWAELPIVAKKIQLDLSAYATKADLAAIPKFAVEVVTELPTENISETTLYLVAEDSDVGDKYGEWIYVGGTWERLGDITVDLSNYYTKAEIDAKLTLAALRAILDSVYIDATTYAAKVEELEGSIAELQTGHNADVEALQGDIGKLETNKLDKTAIGGELTYNGTTGVVEIVGIDGSKITGKVDAAKVEGKVASAGAADTAGRVGNKLTVTVGDGEAQEYDGSEAVNVVIPKGKVYEQNNAGDAKVVVTVDGSGETGLISADLSTNVVADIAKGVDAQGRVITVEGNITTLGGRIDGIDAEIETINGEIAEIQGNVEDLDGRVLALEQEPDIEIPEYAGATGNEIKVEVVDGEGIDKVINASIVGVNVNKLQQTDGDYLILDCGSANV